MINKINTNIGYNSSNVYNSQKINNGFSTNTLTKDTVSFKSTYTYSNEIWRKSDEERKDKAEKILADLVPQQIECKKEREKLQNKERNEIENARLEELNIQLLVYDIEIHFAYNELETTTSHLDGKHSDLFNARADLLNRIAKNAPELLEWHFKPLRYQLELLAKEETELAKIKAGNESIYGANVLVKMIAGRKESIPKIREEAPKAHERFSRYSKIMEEYRQEYGYYEHLGIDLRNS